MKKNVLKKFAAVVLAVCVSIGSGYGTQAMAKSSDGEFYAFTGEAAVESGMDLGSLSEKWQDPEKGVSLKATNITAPILGTGNAQMSATQFSDYVNMTVTQAGCFYGLLTLNAPAGQELTAYIVDTVTERGTTKVIAQGQTQAGWLMELPTGTYEIGFFDAAANTYVDVPAVLTCGVIPTETPANVAFGLEYDSYAADTAYKYYPVTAASAGVLTVQVLREEILSGVQYGSTVTLCDANKNPLKTDVYTTNDLKYNVNFAVDAGSYYIRTSGKSQVAERLYAVFETKAAGSNTSKAKAASLGKSKTSGLLPLTGNTSGERWYKFTLKSAQRNALNIANYSTDATLFYQVLKNNKVIFSSSVPAQKTVYVDYYTSKKEVTNWPKGNYTVRVYKSNPNSNGYFEIDRKTYVVPTKISKVTVGKKKISVKWKKKSGVDGYQIRYSLKSSMKGAKTVTVKKASSSGKTISKLKKGKTYYVQVRTYKKILGKNYYSKWSSKVASKKVK